MRVIKDAAERPRLLGVVCATAAVGLGVCYLAAAGAPARYIGVNVAALLVGLVAFATVSVPAWRIGPGASLVLPSLGALLLATALFGAEVDGASRWVTVGPLNLQVSLLVLPAMLVLFSRDRRWTGVAGLVLAALALALQPDRAMAAALTSGLAAITLVRRDRAVLISLAAAAAAAAVTLARPDELPAVPYVDRIFYTSFDVHPLVGLAVAAGAVLLVVPALSGRRRGGVAAETRLGFAAVWSTVALAAALGNYPTPLVGYGGSAIVGYLLSLAVLSPAPVMAARRRPRTSSGVTHFGAAVLLRAEMPAPRTS